ncbi:MAG: hypothetical protein ACI9YP_000900, partial [Colwellia sp.]
DQTDSWWQSVWSIIGITQWSTYASKAPLIISQKNKKATNKFVAFFNVYISTSF